MTRIFLTLAIINSVALLVALGLGVPYLSDRVAGSDLPLPYGPAASVSWHFVAGLFAAIFTLLVHCLIFTYFLGTGRWVKEVARAYGLPDQLLPRQTREFKRRTFPPALFAMLAAIATAASGAAAQTQAWPWWIHFFLALVTLLVNARAYVIEYRAVAANNIVMEQVMEEVNVIQQAAKTDSRQEPSSA